MSFSRRLLLVEDNPEFRDAVRDALALDRVAVVTAGTLADARAELSRGSFPVLLIDQGLPDGNGIDFLREMKDAGTGGQMIVVAGTGDVPSAVEAMRCGAADYLVKTFTLEELRLRVEAAFRNAKVERQVETLRRVSGRERAPTGPQLVVGRSSCMATLRTEIETFAAAAPSPVLILGETGTGKERVARALHDASPRAAGPFVALNCATFDSTLIDSELFGHEKGAFTSADKQRLGMLELADGGTLFLDEVGEMPIGAQAKLLRALETKSFRRVGGASEIGSDFWIIAATNRDEAAMRSSKDFRADLYYRLAMLVLRVPPLRARLEDLPDLVARILIELAGARAGTFSVPQEAYAGLARHSWPGNVRELRNHVERACILSRDGTLCLELAAAASDGSVGVGVGMGVGAGAATKASGARSLRDAERDLQRQALREALSTTGGNKTQAAKLLDISLTHFKRLYKQHLDVES